MPPLKIVLAHLFNILSRLLTRRPAWNQCDLCGQMAQCIYLLPSPFGISRRCDHCRDTWHHTVRDYYATRAATVAPTQPAPSRRATP